MIETGNKDPIEESKLSDDSVTIEDLKAKVEFLESLVLENESSISKGDTDLLIAKEREIQSLKDQLKAQRLTFHQVELKKRMTLQSKIVESKEVN